MGESRGVHMVLLGKPEEKGPLENPWRRWENNFKMCFQEVGCGDVDWIDLAQVRERWRVLLNAGMNLRFP